MASILKVDTLTGVTTAGSISVTGEGNSTTTNLQQGLAKAWVNLDGTGTIAIRDSFSVSGVADNGTGDYTVTVSSAFGNADYCCAGSSQQSSNGGRGDFFLGLNQETQTTTVRRISTCDSNGTATDSLIANLQLWGDLA